MNKRYADILKKRINGDYLTKRKLVRAKRYWTVVEPNFLHYYPNGSYTTSRRASNYRTVTGSEELYVENPVDRNAQRFRLY